MKRTLLLCLGLATMASATAQNLYNYGFGGVTADLATAGWVRTNQSTQASATLWSVASYQPVQVNGNTQPNPFQNQVYGNGTTCPAPDGQSGGANSFALVNFTSTSSTATTGATISNWLISPVISVQNGDVVSFYTRLGKYAANGQASFADNLQLRMSTNGAATVNPSGGPNGVGDFTQNIIEVNPTLNLTAYPMAWAQYSYTITGLSGATDVKFAFRYFVPNGGPSGTNSDIIGIDTFSVDRPTAGTSDFFRNNLTMYPSPATDVLSIEAGNGLAITGLKITDLNGRTVSQQKAEGISSARVNVSGLNSGVYFLTVETTEGTGTSKFVKR
jgi:hypothetical protein